MACPHCNYAKARRTWAVDPAGSVTARLFNPRTDRWDEHFSWSDDYQQLKGLTTIGR